MPTEAHANASPKGKGKSRFWRHCRIAFRRFRMTVWVLTLLLLGILVYLNLIGLPDFVKRPLQTRLQERGLNLQFAALRLHWTRGFVAEQVVFRSNSETNQPGLPRLTAREVEFNFRLRSLVRGRVQVDAVALRGGKLEWTLIESNAPNRSLAIDGIEASLRLLPDDQWLLEDLRGQFGGANFYFSGSLANASAMRDWQFATDERARKFRNAPEQLRALMDVLAQIKFTTPPELHLDVNGDARNLGSFTVRLAASAKDANTTWGNAREVLFTAQMYPLGTNELSRVEVGLQAVEAETRWGGTTNLDVKVRLVSLARRPDLVKATATCRAGLVTTPWAMLTGTQLKASWTHAVTNPIPSAGQLELHTDSVSTWMTRAVNCDFSAQWSTVTNPLPATPTLGLWTNLLPYQFQCSASVGAVRSLAFQADRLQWEADWSAPRLTLPKFEATLYNGAITGDATVDVVTRATSVTVASSFDPKRIAPLLPKEMQALLGQITWGRPPQLRCAATAVLPDWNSPGDNWPAALLPTLQLAGHLALTNVTGREIFADAIATSFTLTNLVWEFPDLEIQRPEGGLHVFHRTDERTLEYYFRVHSTIDPRAVLPLFNAQVRRGFDLCEFSQPPVVSGELWGRWDDPAQTGFRGNLALTNFAFRGERLDAITTELRYTNLLAEATDLRAWHGTQHVAVAGITADFPAQRIYITNAIGSFDPGSIVRMIGPNVAAVMAPYHFGQPPVARAHGYVSMHDPHDANIIFEGSGADFESLRFRIPRYTAQVIWQNNFLTVTNAHGDFYGGTAGGWANFVFTDHNRARFAFNVDVTNANLSALVADLSQKTNNLDGQLSGRLVITNALTDDLQSWNGYGNASLRDGLLWELPIFGALSSSLDVGNNRFTEAGGTYAIANSIIYSPDLEMRSSALRLLYRGTVTFNGAISARVTAEVLRDTPVVGTMVSTLLSPVAKLLAYRISGTLKEPKYEPIYIPKILLVPFSPLQTLEQLFTSDPVKTEPPPPETK